MSLLSFSRSRQRTELSLFSPQKITEYLAISTVSSPALTLSHPPNLTSSKPTSIIQIWSLNSPHPEKTLTVETETSEQEGEGESFKFEMGLLCGDNEGEAKDLQWCPKGGSGTSTSSSKEDEMDLDLESRNDYYRDRLGVLAGVFTDGKVKVFIVPNPERVREKQGGGDETVYGELFSFSLLFFKCMQVVEKGSTS